MSGVETTMRASHAAATGNVERQWRWLLLLLIAAVIATAIGVVYAKHLNRKLFVELQNLQAQRDQMNIEWGQLQLEQGAWATHSRIEQIADSRLNMHLPAPEHVKIVRLR